MINQTVPPFKLEETKDLITAHTGLALSGEFAVGPGFLEALDKNLRGPGSGAGYRAIEHMCPILLMLDGGVPGGQGHDPLEDFWKAVDEYFGE